MHNDSVRYIKTINEIFDSISNIRTDKFEHILKATLQFSFIDLLAIGLYGADLSPRNRFIKIVEQYSNWEYWDYISVPILLSELKKDNNFELYDLKKNVERQFSNFMVSSPVSLNYDIDFKDLENYVSSNYKIANRSRLAKFRHVELLYNFRNSLTHELRSKFNQYNMFELTEPHYNWELKYKKNIDTGEFVNLGHAANLIYPFEFIEAFTISIKENVQIKLNLNEIDQNPYKNYNFDNTWIY